MAAQTWAPFLSEPARRDEPWVRDARWGIVFPLRLYFEALSFCLFSADSIGAEIFEHARRTASLT